MTNFKNIPDYLKENGLFCLWRYEENQKGQKTKVPYSPPERRQKSRQHEPRNICPSGNSQCQDERV